MTMEKQEKINGVVKIISFSFDRRTAEIVVLSPAPGTAFTPGGEPRKWVSRTLHVERIEGNRYGTLPAEDKSRRICTLN